MIKKLLGTALLLASINIAAAQQTVYVESNNYTQKTHRVTIDKAIPAGTESRIYTRILEDVDKDGAFDVITAYYKGDTLRQYSTAQQLLDRYESYIHLAPGVYYYDSQDRLCEQQYYYYGRLNKEFKKGKLEALTWFTSIAGGYRIYRAKVEANGEVGKIKGFSRADKKVSINDAEKALVRETFEDMEPKERFKYTMLVGPRIRLIDDESEPRVQN